MVLMKERFFACVESIGLIVISMPVVLGFCSAKQLILLVGEVTGVFLLQSLITGKMGS